MEIHFIILFHNGFGHLNCGSMDRRIKNNVSAHSVISLALGYGLKMHKVFVGSLRCTGYSGAIILGVSSRPPPNTESAAYLSRHAVRTHPVPLVPCKHQGRPRRCAEAYPQLKLEWARFLLMRDWLQACVACTGWVLVADYRDVLFQSDPFAQARPQPPSRPPSDAYEILLFEEHPSVTPSHWIVATPVQACEPTRSAAVLGRRPMLCSGTTLAKSRRAMLRYLRAMEVVFGGWLSTPGLQPNASAAAPPQSRLVGSPRTKGAQDAAPRLPTPGSGGGCLDQYGEMRGDDQAVHNLLFYTGVLGREARTVKHRTGIVHTVGYEAGKLLAHYTRASHGASNRSVPSAHPPGNRREPTAFGLQGAAKEASESPGAAQWLAPSHNLTNAAGSSQILMGASRLWCISTTGSGRYSGGCGSLSSHSFATTRVALLLVKPFSCTVQ